MIQPTLPVRFLGGDFVPPFSQDRNTEVLSRIAVKVKEPQLYKTLQD